MFSADDLRTLEATLQPDFVRTAPAAIRVELYLDAAIHPASLFESEEIRS